MTFIALINRTAAAMAVVGVAFVATAAFRSPQQKDPKEAFEKLRRIGVALQLYRAEYGSKPIGERSCFADAGLPANIVTLTEPGHSWTLPMSDFQLSYSRYGDSSNQPEFVALYWPQEFYSELGDISRYYAQRGDKLPILVDEDFNRKLPEGVFVRKSPALRLDGSVGWIEYDVRDLPTRLEK
ncbi:MAG: hypothetical protein KIT11_01160 [Fimbriimonadaceae bacterium]|nr:hypothetical protein [Fimbriimonadaceae bacterium]QYK55017.1 MAG: hypothetical protein KF733_08375 [Fimbriimonadaceae bacterium]